MVCSIIRRLFKIVEISRTLQRERLLDHYQRQGIYNVSAFLTEHPGGPEIILDQAGKDATEDFENTNNSPEARATLKKYYVGEAEGATPVRTMKAETSPSIIPSIIFLLIVILLGAFLNSNKNEYHI
jgi:cytochrome b involved in lipid metabolism